MYETDTRFEQIKKLYKNNKIEIIEMLIFLWIDIICDEEDEELMKIYENIYDKINFCIETSKIEFPNRSKSGNDFINKMIYNIITDYPIDKKNLDNSKNIKLKEGENSDNDIKHRKLLY